MSQARRSGRFVVPGERLGVIEEFIPNSGTYEENGAIRSENVGHVLLDFASKKVSVYPVTHGLNVPIVGSVVVGTARSVQSSVAVIRMMKVGEEFISGHFTGMIHVSDVSFRYTENMFDAYKVADLVRAKVISDKNKVFHLSTKGENLGVLYAYCSYCGGLLIRRGRGLACETCGHMENRKTASDYGKGEL